MEIGRVCKYCHVSAYVAYDNCDPVYKQTFKFEILPGQHNSLVWDKIIKIFKKNKQDNNINLENVDNDNAFYISPPKLDERASNFRFISSLDNELSNLEKVFDKLDLELKDNRIQKVRNLINKELDYKEDAEKFLIAFRERLDLLAIYKNALEFIPLKPPMEHYYVTSKYGKENIQFKKMAFPSWY